MSARVESGPIAAAESERLQIEQVDRLLRARRDQVPRLVGPEGEEVPLPESIFAALRQVADAMINGHAVSVIPVHMQLTTQQAADLLGVSRPYLIRLLDEEHIPFTRIGTHRRVRFADLMAYKEERDSRRRQGLAELTQLSQDLGLYSLD